MRRCNIPAQTLPPCDLEWGHDGDMHANEGDGFYARQHLNEHHSRQTTKKLIDVLDPTIVECPTCAAWVGWACEGDDYGYHGAGYHPTRHEAARRAQEVADAR